MTSTSQLLKVNWFVPLAAILLGAAWLIVRQADASDLASLELAIMFDVIVTVPALYWLCYRRSLSNRAMAIRLVSIACGGLYIASLMVPAGEQHWLKTVQPFRLVGIVVIIAAELALAIAVMRVAFRPKTTVNDIQSMGAPKWIARLMLLEARFWRWLFSKLRR